MAHRLEAPRRLDEGQHSMSRDTETKSSLLQHHLSLYNDLMKVQPQRHTEQQLKMEREQRRMKVLHEEQTELERIRQKYQVEGAGKGGKSSVFDTDFESRRREMILKERAMEKRRNEEEAFVIQDERRLERKDKVVKPKWYEVEYKKKMDDVKERSEQLWKQGRKPQSYNIWDKRKEDHERHHKELEEMLPKNEADEEQMLRKAIEMSRQTAEQSIKEVSKSDQRSGRDLTRSYKNKSQLDSIWDIDSVGENESKWASKHQDYSHVGYAMAVKKKRVHETCVPNFISKPKLNKEQSRSQTDCDSTVVGLTRVHTMHPRGRGTLLLKDSVTPHSLDSTRAPDSKIASDNSVDVAVTSQERLLGFTERSFNPKVLRTNTTSNPRCNSGEENNSSIKSDQNNNNFTTSNLQTDSYCISGEDWNKECSDWYVYCGPQFDSQGFDGAIDSKKGDGSMINKHMINSHHPEWYKDSKDPDIPSVHSSKGYTDSSDDTSSSETDSDFHFPRVSFVASKKGAQQKQTTEKHPLQSVLKKETPANKEDYGEVYVPLITNINMKSGRKTVTFANDESKSTDCSYKPLITNVDVKSGKKTVTFENVEPKSFDSRQPQNGSCSYTETSDDKDGDFTYGNQSRDHAKEVEKDSWNDKSSKKHDKVIDEDIQKELTSYEKQSKSNQENKSIVNTSEISQMQSENYENKDFKALNDARNKSAVISEKVPKCSQSNQPQENPIPPPCAQGQTLGVSKDSSQQITIPEGLPEHMYQSYFNYIHESRDKPSQNKDPIESLAGCQDSVDKNSEQASTYIHPFMNPFILANYYTPETLQMMMAQAQELMKQCQIGSEQQKGEKGQADKENWAPCMDSSMETHVAKSDSTNSDNNKMCNSGVLESTQDETEHSDTLSDDSFAPSINLKGSLGVCERKLRMPKFPAVATRLSRKNLLSLNIDLTVQSSSKETSQEAKQTNNDNVTDYQKLPVCHLQQECRQSDLKEQSNKQGSDKVRDKKLTDEQCGWVEIGAVTKSVGRDGYGEYNFWGTHKEVDKYTKTDTLSHKDHEIDRPKSFQASNIANFAPMRPKMSGRFTDRRENMSAQNRTNTSANSKRCSIQSDFKSTLDHNRMIRDAIKEIRKQAKVKENEVTESGDAVKKLRYF